MRSLTAVSTMLVSLFLAVPCRANLGDTLARCEARYGPAIPGKDTPDPSGVGDVLLTFQSKGYLIRIILLGGHTVGECFTKASGAALTDAEKQLLLQNDAQGWAWAHQTAVAGENWLRTDGAVATYAPQFHSMVLETAPYVNAVKTKQATQQAK